jgi:hypothetical protein
MWWIPSSLIRSPSRGPAAEGQGDAEGDEHDGTPGREADWHASAIVKSIMTIAMAGTSGHVTR